MSEKGCPLCGDQGTEEARQPAIKDNKLVERVTMICPHAEAVIRWTVYDDSIRDYSDDHSPHGGYRRKLNHHPENMADGEQVVEFIPTVNAIRQLDKAEAIAQSKNADASNWRAMLQSRVRKYSS